MKRPVLWAYGVTTCPARRCDLLPRTLASLAAAGFDEPRLFVDGLEGCEMCRAYQSFGLELTFRAPAIRTAGNWTLALAELYIRQPLADRYAVFQDDLVAYRNLRQYLESCEYPPQGYWNLYTFPHNLLLCKGQPGWHLSDQLGKGAVGLVFSREAVVALFTQKHLVDRPQNLKRGWRAIDGGVVTAMAKAGWKEYIHNPSLVQHTGVHSSMRNAQHKLADSFRGESFDALDLTKSQ